MDWSIVAIVIVAIIGLVGFSLMIAAFGMAINETSLNGGGYFSGDLAVKLRGRIVECVLTHHEHGWRLQTHSTE